MSNEQRYGILLRMTTADLIRYRSRAIKEGRALAAADAAYILAGREVLPGSVGPDPRDSSIDVVRLARDA